MKLVLLFYAVQCVLVRPASTWHRLDTEQERFALSLHRLDTIRKRFNTSWHKLNIIRKRFNSSWHKLNIIRKRFNSSWHRLNIIRKRFNSSWHKLNIIRKRFNSSWHRFDTIQKQSASTWHRLDTIRKRFASSTQVHLCVHKAHRLGPKCLHFLATVSPFIVTSSSSSFQDCRQTSGSVVLIKLVVCSTSSLQPPILTANTDVGKLSASSLIS